MNQLHVQDLVQHLQATHGLPRRQATAYTNTVLNAIRDIPPNTCLTVRNLGLFTRYTMPERQAHNPRTGDPVTAPSRDTLRFRPSKNIYGTKA